MTRRDDALKARRERTIRAVAWTLPLALHAADAAAWGLYTHTFFAQLLLWAVPLADERFRRALARFPGLVLAGACLPDVSLFSRLIDARPLRTTHQWTVAARMLRHADDDGDRAIALGYAAHLLTDIVAHNYFVPAHERMWFRCGMLSHGLCEWAMDAHVAPHLYVTPGRLMEEHAGALARFATSHLGVEPASATRTLTWLARGERLLRAARVPRIVYRASRSADSAVSARFDDYVRETGERLRQVNRLIAGETPAWLPEPETPTQAPRRDVSSHHPYLALLPSDFFRRRGYP